MSSARWPGCRCFCSPPPVGGRGKVRTTPLTFFRDATDLVVVASNGGADRPPDWALNLQQTPRAVVEIRTDKVAVTARPASQRRPPRPRPGFRILHVNGYSGVVPRRSLIQAWTDADGVLALSTPDRMRRELCRAAGVVVWEPDDEGTD